MAEFAESLAGRVRRSGMIDNSVGLSARMHEGAVVVTPTAAPAHGVETLFNGLRINRDGQVSVWTSFPRDDLGSIIDQGHLSKQIAKLLRLIGALRVINSQFVAIAVGVEVAGFLSIGKVTDMPRSSATHISLSQGLMRTLPDEQVSLAALDVGATEMGPLLSRALVGAIEDAQKRNPF